MLRMLSSTSMTTRWSISESHRTFLQPQQRSFDRSSSVSRQSRNLSPFFAESEPHWSHVPGLSPGKSRCRRANIQAQDGPGRWPLGTNTTTKRNSNHEKYSSTPSRDMTVSRYFPPCESTQYQQPQLENANVYCDSDWTRLVLTTQPAAAYYCFALADAPYEDLYLDHVLLETSLTYFHPRRGLRDCYCYYTSSLLLITLGRIGILHQICWQSQESVSAIQSEWSEPWNRRHRLCPTRLCGQSSKRSQRNARRQETNEGKHDLSTYPGRYLTRTRSKWLWMQAGFLSQHRPNRLRIVLRTQNQAARPSQNH